MSPPATSSSGPLPVLHYWDVDALREISAQFHSGLYAKNRFRTGKKVKLRARDVKAMRLVLEDGVPSDNGVTSVPIAEGARLARGASPSRGTLSTPHTTCSILRA